MIDEYSVTTDVMREIEKWVLRRRHFLFLVVPQEYGSWTRGDALLLIHLLSERFVQNKSYDCKWSRPGRWKCSNGPVESIHERLHKYGEYQLILRPFCNPKVLEGNLLNFGMDIGSG